jgi:hypothetical protein
MKPFDRAIRALISVPHEKKDPKPLNDNSKDLFRFSFALQNP